MRHHKNTEGTIAGQHGPGDRSQEPPRSKLPTILALLIVATVWVLGCVWSFTEQTAFARSHHFAVPELLPLILDGMATALAGVAYAASLDGRPALGARMGTAVAVAISATSNGLWAAERSDQDMITIGLGVVVPCTAMLAFEVLLGELRRQVQRRRGDPAPVRIPYPRIVRLVLAPLSTLTAWRRLVLEMTALDPAGTPTASPQAQTTPSSGEIVQPTPAAPAKPAPVTTSAEPAQATAPPAEQAAATGERKPPAARVQPAEPIAATDQGPPQAQPTPRTSAPTKQLRGQKPESIATGTLSDARPVPTPTPQDLSVGDERVGHIAGMLRRGEEPTGEQIGALFNCSDRTGRRLIEKAREVLADHPHLQVVGTATGQE